MTAPSTGVVPVGERRWSGTVQLRGLLTSQVGVLLAVVAVIAVVAELDNPVFLTADNVVALLRAGVTTFVIGCAATVVFTSAGLDLSVGAVFTAGGVVAALLMHAGVPWPLAVLIAVASGAVLGAVNAGLVILAKVPPIIATLSTLYAISGLALVLTGGNPITPLPDGFDAIGQANLGQLPWLIVYAALIGVVFHVVLARTRFGYDVQALGGNERGALANGVPVRAAKSVVYIISGAVAALAGILYASRTGAADPQSGGTGITLEVIAAVLIGGTSLFGGIGTISGTALGAVLFAEIDNALTVVGVDPLYQNIIIGAILAAAVAADSFRRSRAFRISSRA